VAKSIQRAKRFRALLEKECGMGWTIARFPFEPSALWSRMIRLRVCGAMNGVPFRTSLFADEAGFYLMVNRATQRSAGVACGDMVEISLEPDLEPRPAELPDELAALLEDEPGLRSWYDELSESMRREIGKWVLGVKSEASRVRRAQQMAERLLATMEAEKELPPLIAKALRARPKAKQGWERMTPVQRKQQLLGVFYYQTLDARQRRLEKLVDVAIRRCGDA
jgi:uncharacterized protein YdeI (YjbR/CyaY-like superfamily)